MRAHMIGWMISMIVMSFLVFTGIVFVNATTQVDTGAARVDCRAEGGSWTKLNNNKGFCSFR